MQKYERGANRVSASRLWQMAAALDVPVTFFFDGAGTGFEGAVRASGFADIQAGFEPPAALLTSREAVELVTAFQRIADPVQRKRLLELIKSMAATS